MSARSEHIKHSGRYRSPLRTLFALLLGCSALLAPLALRAQVEMLDQVVAIVDDDIIMASELRERVAQFTQALEARGGTPPPEDVLIRETLDRLILESIQLQMGDRYGIRIADSQLDAAMQRLAAQNGLNLEQFRQALVQEGRSYAQMRENIRREMILQRVQMGNVNQRVELSEQEVRGFMATEEGQKLVQPEYRVVHALLPLSSTVSAEQAERAEAYMNSLLEQIRSGRSFDEVMAAADGQQGYRFTGGDLGWRKRDDLPSLFQDVAPALQTGETADVFRSPSGLHLVHLLDRRGVGSVVQQTEVRHILLKPSEIRSEEETRELASALRERILAGEDFAALAREYSEDIGSAAEGGELGWTSPGQMVPEFENTMASTETGDLSMPVRSQFGWHILQVTDRRQKDMTEQQQMAVASEYLHSRKYEEELDAWLRKIRDEAFVDIK